MQTAHVKLFTTDGIDSLRNVAYQVDAREGRRRPPDHRQPARPPDLDDGHAARSPDQYLKGALEIDRKMTSGVHEHGALIFAQLNHFGLNATSDSADDLRVLWGPSAVKSPAYGETPKAMEHEDIAEVVEWWARSAELAREGGFDGTEVHIAHSYLLHQFLSPVYNKRDDEYGGSLENRLRFTREVIDEVRRRTGDDWVDRRPAHASSDFIGEGALDIEDAKETVRLLESWCKLDFVNVSAAGYHNIFKAIEPSDVPDGFLVDLSAQVKATTDLPVFTIGGIKDRGARRGDPRLGQGGHGRDDARADRRPRVREQGARGARGRDHRTASAATRAASAASSRGCRSTARSTRPPAARRASAPARSSRPRRRSGAGSSSAAGPAGMRRRSRWRARGHEVTLARGARSELGGQINLILQTPGPRDVRLDHASTSSASCGKLGVDVRLGTRGDRRSSSASSRPDAVLLATGAVPSTSGFSSGEPARRRAAGRPLRSNVSRAGTCCSGRGRSASASSCSTTTARARPPGVAEVLLDRGARRRARDAASTTLFPQHVYHLDHGPRVRALLRKGLALPAERLGERDRRRHA